MAGGGRADLVAAGESLPSAGTPAGALAVVVRGGRVESVHLGHLAIVRPDGAQLFAVGDPGTTIWPRSAVKPVQAVAMLRAGLEIDDAGLALACASHSGTPEQVNGVRAILARAGLTEGDLQNTPDLPLDPESSFAWRSGGVGAASVTQNCSGKHAAMLAACVRNGWDTVGYRDPDHPLQRRVRETLAELSGEPVADVTVDGCGAPLFSTTVVGLARAFGRIAAAGTEPGRDDAEARVARAMTAHPWLVGGPGRDVSRFMAAMPGLIVKDGAEGVYAAGLGEGSAVAFKVADGSARPRAAILAASLEVLWRQAGRATPEADAVAAVREIGELPVLGHGLPVGRVVAVLGELPAGRGEIGRQG